MTKIKRLPALVTAALPTAGVALASPSAAHLTGRPAPRDVTANAAHVLINHNGGDNACAFRNLHSRKCVEVGFGGREDLNGVSRYTCHDGPHQRRVLN